MTMFEKFIYNIINTTGFVVFEFPYCQFDFFWIEWPVDRLNFSSNDRIIQWRDKMMVLDLMLEMNRGRLT